MQLRRFEDHPTRWVLSGARAINPERLEIDEKKCILCYACLPTCPKNMLSKYMVPGPELDMWFKNQNSHRAEPVTFI